MFTFYFLVVFFGEKGNALYFDAYVPSKKIVIMCIRSCVLYSDVINNQINRLQVCLKYVHSLLSKVFKSTQVHIHITLCLIIYANNSLFVSNEKNNCELKHK